MRKLRGFGSMLLFVLLTLLAALVHAYEKELSVLLLQLLGRCRFVNHTLHVGKEGRTSLGERHFKGRIGKSLYTRCHTASCFWKSSNE